MRPQTQRGYIYDRNCAFHVRYYAHEGGVRKQRSYRLCSMDQDHPSKDAPAVIKLAEDFMLRNQHSKRLQRRPARAQLPNLRESL